MARKADPTEPIRKMAAKLADEKGMSCNQSSFKAGKGSFLFIGPGAKGAGYKAMFKLHDSIPQAKKLAVKEPDKFQVGNTNWVTVRFSADNPFSKTIWEKWLKESHAITAGLKQKPVKKKKAVKKKKSVKKK